LAVAAAAFAGCGKSKGEVLVPKPKPAGLEGRMFFLAGESGATSDLYEGVFAPGLFLYRLTTTQRIGGIAGCRTDLTVTNADGLSDTATVRIRLTDEGRTSPDHSVVQILAYPNPVQSILHLRFTGEGISGPAQIRIYDMKATLLSAQQVQIGGSGQEATIDMSKMARGVYALQIVMGGAKGVAAALGHGLGKIHWLIPFFLIHIIFVAWSLWLIVLVLTLKSFVFNLYQSLLLGIADAVDDYDREKRARSNGAF